MHGGILAIAFLIACVPYAWLPSAATAGGDSMTGGPTATREIPAVLQQPAIAETENGQRLLLDLTIRPHVLDPETPPILRVVLEDRETGVRTDLGTLAFFPPARPGQDRRFTVPVPRGVDPTRQRVEIRLVENEVLKGPNDAEMEVIEAIFRR